MSRYEIKKELSKGTFGKVYDGDFVDDSGKSIPVVFKILTKDDIDSYTSECNDFIKNGPNAPGKENIVSILDCFDCIKDESREESRYSVCKNNKASGTRLIVLEKMKYTLSEYFEILEEEINYKEIFLQICKGVKYLHDHGYIHTDIKPPNIMINTSSKNIKPGDVKIIDLGTISNVKQGTFSLGTPGFQDFCQYNKDTKFKGDLFSIDIYQLGATFFDIFTGMEFQNFNEETDVFPDKPSPEDVYLTKDEEYAHAPPIYKLIIDMTLPDCNERPNINQVIKRLKEIEI